MVLMASLQGRDGDADVEMGLWTQRGREAGATPEKVAPGVHT